MKRHQGGTRWGNDRDRRGGGGNQQRGGMISPWENGLAPGQVANIMPGYQSMSGPMMGGGMMEPSPFGDSYSPPSKMRRIDMMGSYNDRHSGRGLLPAPLAPLMGGAPQGFGSSRSSDIQQRLGPWIPAKSDTSNRPFYAAQRNSANNSQRKSHRRPPTGGHNSSSRPRNRDRRDSNRDNYKRQTSKSSETKASKKPDEESASNSESPSKDDAKKTDDGSEKTEKTEKPKEEKKDKVVVDNYPVEAMYCHICDLKPFTTRRGFIRHLEGVSHGKMAETFHARNDAVRTLLTTSSKLAEMRRKDKTIRSADKKPPAGKLVEQALMKRYHEPISCCGKSYKSHYDYNEHRLSLTHLRKVFSKGQPEDVQAEQQINLSKATVEEIDKMLAEAKAKYEEEPISVANLPTYDPSIPIGMNFIEKVAMYKCSVCKESNILSLEEHCQAIGHFDAMVKKVNQEEQRKREEEEKLKEEEAKLKIKKEIKEEKETEETEEKPKDESTAIEEEEDPDKLFNEYLQQGDDMIILDEDDRENAASDDATEEKEDENVLADMEEVGNSIDEKDDKYDPEEALNGIEQTEETTVETPEPMEAPIEESTKEGGGEEGDEEEIQEPETPRRRLRNRNL